MVLNQVVLKTVFIWVLFLELYICSMTYDIFFVVELFWRCCKSISVRMYVVDLILQARMKCSVELQINIDFYSNMAIIYVIIVITLLIAQNNSVMSMYFKIQWRCMSQITW